MVLHPDDEHWTSSLIFTAEPIFSRGVNLSNDLFLFGYFVRSIVFVPFDPVPPHFDDLFLLKLSSNAESGGSVNVGIKFLFGGQLRVLLPIDVDHFPLVGLNLRELAVGDEERICFGGLHCCYI